MIRLDLFILNFLPLNLFTFWLLRCYFFRLLHNEVIDITFVSAGFGNIEEYFRNKKNEIKEWWKKRKERKEKEKKEKNDTENDDDDMDDDIFDDDYSKHPDNRKPDNRKPDNLKDNNKK